MKAVIFAGGQGLRLRPVTYEIPKPLIPVRRKPLLNYLVEFLNRCGVTEAAVISHFDYKNDFEKWLISAKPLFPQTSLNLFFESQRQGTFGCLRLVREWLGGSTFIASIGDALIDFDFNKLKEAHFEQRPVVSVAFVQIDNANEFVSPVLGNDGFVNGLSVKSEKQRREFNSVGFYIIEPEIFRYDSFSKKVVDIDKDVFPKLWNERKVIGVKMEKGRFFECGSLEGWEKAILEW